jgi:hypothetical protein
MALVVAADKDPRARSFAVRALASHVSQPEALACLGARLADSHWQVRRGAAGALAAAPAASAVPLLLDARRRATGEEAATLDRHLFGHTGLHFPDVAGWEAWWTERGDAVREGSFEKAEGKPPPHAATDLFGLPLGSQNVLFVLDLSDDARDHAADVQNKVAGAIEVLPDGARFNVVAIGEKERRFSKGPAAASPRTRAEARRWLERQEASGYGIVERFLDAMRADYDGSVGAFEDLPDTIYLVAASGKVEDVALPVDSFRHWNRPVGAVVHAVALGTKAPVGLLHRLATATGGAYSGPSTDG